MYRVEFGFGENIEQVQEWQTIDGLDVMEANDAEHAAMDAANTDGLENALFRVYELTKNEFGTWEKSDPHNPEYFSKDDFHPEWQDWPNDDWPDEDPIEGQKQEIESIKYYLNIKKETLEDNKKMIADDPEIANADWMKHSMESCEKSIMELEERLREEENILERMVKENETAI